MVDLFPNTLKPLFLAVTSKVYSWYDQGKEWELRQYGLRDDGKRTPWNESTIQNGRAICVSKGYNGRKRGNSWMGTISEEPIIGTLDQILNKIDYQKIVPVADSREDCVRIVRNITDCSQYIAFRIKKP
jgi:hypothetical protein